MVLKEAESASINCFLKLWLPLSFCGNSDSFFDVLPAEILVSSNNLKKQQFCSHERSTNMIAWTFAEASVRCHRSVNNIRVAIPIGIKKSINPSSETCCCLSSLRAQLLQIPEVQGMALEKLYWEH